MYISRNQKRGDPMSQTDLISLAKQAGAVRAIVNKRSHELTEVIQTLADGAVCRFGEPFNQATRTEINFVPLGKVVIHKNPGHGIGIYAQAGRFDLIEVFSGEICVAQVQIRLDPDYREINPVYEFFDGENRIATAGYGQSMDLALASDLLGVSVGGDGDHIPHEMVVWIREKLNTGD